MSLNLLVISSALASAWSGSYPAAAPMALTLHQALTAAQAPETSEPIGVVTGRFWSDLLVTQSATLDGGTSGAFLVACKTKIIGPNSRAPRHEFQGCDVSETPASVHEDLPVLSLKDLLTLTLPVNPPDPQ